jgi:hypothetical protein
MCSPSQLRYNLLQSSISVPNRPIQSRIDAYIPPIMSMGRHYQEDNELKSESYIQATHTLSENERIAIGGIPVGLRIIVSTPKLQEYRDNRV